MGPDLRSAYQVVLQSGAESVQQSTPGVGTVHLNCVGHTIPEVPLTKPTVPPAADDLTALPDPSAYLCPMPPVADNNMP